MLQLQHFSFLYQQTPTGHGKIDTVVSYQAAFGAPVDDDKRVGLVGTITYQPTDEDRGFIVPIWLAVPHSPSHPLFMRVAFFSQEACELFLKSQLLEHFASEEV